MGVYVCWGGGERVVGVRCVCQRWVGRWVLAVGGVVQVRLCVGGRSAVGVVVVRRSVGRWSVTNREVGVVRRSVGCGSAVGVVVVRRSAGGGAVGELAVGRWEVRRRLVSGRLAVRPPACSLLSLIILS